MRKITLSFLLLIAIIFKAEAQFQYNFTLIKDINVKMSPNKSSWPHYFTKLNDSQFVFIAYTDSAGYELWVSDGTEDGTKLVKDINTDSPPYTEDCCDETEIIRFGNKVIFFAETYEYGVEPWISDGTEVGTYLLKNIRPEPSTYGYGSSPKYLAYLNGSVFFFANDGSGEKLFITDGTEQGTNPLLNIPGLSVPSLLDENPFVEYNGKLYFPARASNTNNKTSLWVTDGTSSGTYQIKNIHVGYFDNVLASAQLNGILYFNSDSNSTSYQGRELWRTDGTESGTHIVADINSTSGPSGSNPHNFAVLNNKLYFNASTDAYGSELYEYDGINYSLVKDIHQFDGSNPQYLYTYKDRIYFSAFNEFYQYVLYVTDGTSNGTKILREDIFEPQYFFEWDNKLFIISQSSDTYNYELWVTTGDEDSIFRVTPLSCDIGGIPYITDNALFFNVAIGIDNNNNIGYELYKFTKTPNLSTDDINLIDQIYVFPNPFSDHITIQSNGKSEINEIILFDIIGNKILSQKNNEKTYTTSIALSGISPGFYCLTVINSDLSIKNIRLIKH